MPRIAKKQLKKVNTDVLVVGGGTAGFVAAIAAARNGAKTLLLEQRDHLGGTHTGGMVMMIRSMRHMKAPKTLEEKKLLMTGYESSFDDEQLVRSITQEYLNRMLEIGAAWGQKDQAAARQLFDPEIGKWVIQQMIEEAGVEVWLNTAVSDILMEGNIVTGVVVDSLRDNIEIRSKITIDSTGDGDIAAAAGAMYEQGAPDDGHCQPLTLYYAIGGVNLEKTLAYMRENPGEFGADYVERTMKLKSEGKPFTLFTFKEKVKEALKNGDYPIPYGIDSIDPDKALTIIRTMYRNGQFRYDVTFHNMDMAYNVDATDRVELSKATLAMRDLTNRMAIFYQKYMPGYEDSYLAYTAQSVGVRDTRRIVGDYILTDEDVLQGRSFDDGIGRYGSVMDVHDKTGKKSLSLVEVGGKGWFHIPFRTLLPKGVSNLMVAGRCISAEFNALGSVRSQAASMITGQAVGTAAALAIRGNVEPRHLDISKLQETLREQNQII